jgi:DNA-binding beta-propeller fold protein YncE
MSSTVLKGSLSLTLACACTFSVTARLNAQSVIATIPAAGFVGGGSVDPIARRAYIPTGNNNGVSAVVTVIDERTNTVARTINFPTAWAAVSVALNPLNGLLYVGTGSGGLYVANARTGATVGFVNVNAASVALNPVTDKIYVSDFESNIYVIDGNTNHIEADIPINSILQNIAVNPITNRIYAAIEDFNPGSVYVIDGGSNQIIAQAPAGSGLTFDVAVDPLLDTFYSGDQFGTATAYNGGNNKQVTAISLPNQPAGVAADPLTHTIYVSESTGNGVAVINGSTNTLTETVAVRPQPVYMTDDPVNKLLYVGCQGVDSNGFPTYSISVVKTN